MLRRIALALGLAAGCFFTRVVRLHAVDAYRDGQRYQDVYYLPRADLLPLLSLGYQAALADLLWCKSLVYFGEELGHRGPVRYLFQYTDAILALDPSFREPYRWVATAALYRPVTISMADGMHALSYLARAVQRWPDDGELRWDYGSMLRFELAPLEKDRARKRALLVRAAPQLEAAARLGAGPPWLVVDSADLLNKLGQTEQAIRHLEELRDTVQAPEIRKEIEARILRLRTQTYIEAVGAAEQKFEAARLRSYPYLSPGLFLWVGEPNATYEHFVTSGFTSE